MAASGAGDRARDLTLPRDGGQSLSLSENVNVLRHAEVVPAAAKAL